MTVKCAQCGEEVLGAVNRCWQCGAPIASRPGDVNLPPVRGAPIADSAAAGPDRRRAEPPTDDAGESDGAVLAQLADGESGHHQTLGEHTAGEPGAPPVAAASATPASSITHGAGSEAVAPRYPRYAASVGGSIASLVLGALSLIASFYTASAVVTAVLGIGMGIWGLYSTRRGPAILGILLGCGAMAIGGVNGVVRMYEYRPGYNPWDSLSPYEPLGVPRAGLSCGFRP